MFTIDLLKEKSILGHLPRVTHILSKTSHNDYIDKWKNNVGHEEAERVIQKAFARGTSVHKHLEAFLLDKPHEKDIYKDIASRGYSHIKEIFNGGTLLASELPLQSDNFKFRGTLDCLIKNAEGKYILIDFKTSKSKKYRHGIDDYFIQCAFYSIALKEVYNIDVSMFHILMLVIPDEEEGVLQDEFNAKCNVSYFDESNVSYYQLLATHRLNQFNKISR